MRIISLYKADKYYIIMKLNSKIFEMDIKWRFSRAFGQRCKSVVLKSLLEAHKTHQKRTKTDHLFAKADPCQSGEAWAFHIGRQDWDPLCFGVLKSRTAPILTTNFGLWYTKQVSVYRRPPACACGKTCAGREDFTPAKPAAWAGAGEGKAGPVPLCRALEAFNPAPGPRGRHGAAAAQKRRSHSKERQENFYDYDRRVKG
jgi:hypothetical protein